MDKIEIKKIEIDARQIPKGAELVEAYKTATEIVVCGDPEENHNCDEMGCSTLSHVIYRFPLCQLFEPKPDEVCPECKGTGRVDNMDEAFPCKLSCHSCKGTGIKKPDEDRLLTDKEYFDATRGVYEWDTEDAIMKAQDAKTASIKIEAQCHICLGEKPWKPIKNSKDVWIRFTVEDVALKANHCKGGE